MNKVTKKIFFVILLIALTTTSTPTLFGFDFARRFFVYTTTNPFVGYIQRNLAPLRNIFQRSNENQDTDNLQNEQPQQKQNSLIDQAKHVADMSYSKAQLVQKNLLKGFDLIRSFFVYTKTCSLVKYAQQKCSSLSNNLVRQAKRKNSLFAQAKLFSGISHSNAQLVQEALHEGANLNKGSCHIFEQHLVSYIAPPLALSRTLHPDIIKILIAHGANPNKAITHYSQIDHQFKDISIIEFFITRFLCSPIITKPLYSPKIISHSLESTLKECATIKALLDEGAQEDLQAIQDTIYKYRKNNIPSPHLRSEILYHMLGTYCHNDYSTFIDYINKQDQVGVNHFCNPSFVNKKDRFGLLPLDYAMSPEILQPNEKIIQKLMKKGATPNKSHILAASPTIKQILFRESKCPICLNPPTEVCETSHGETPCCHSFICQDDLAILQARGDTCPLCRKPLQ